MSANCSAETEQNMESRKFHNGELIKRLNDKVEKAINNQLLTYDLTSTQSKMLVMLHLIPDHTAMLKELEKYFGVAQSTAAGIIARLEKKNLVLPSLMKMISGSNTYGLPTMAFKYA